MKTYFLILLVGAMNISALGQSVINVPQSTVSVLIDGKHSATEWNDAYVIPVNDSLKLYFKQDAENLYLSVRHIKGTPSLLGVDFYISYDSTLFNLHASAKLGERKLTGKSYGDWIWWNNENWVANVARFNAFTGSRFLADESKEFQLRKSRFMAKSIRLMFSEDKVPPASNPSFPSGALPNDVEKWLVLNL